MSKNHRHFFLGERKSKRVMIFNDVTDHVIGKHLK